MYKFSCFLICVVGVSLNSVHITKAESLRDTLRPLIMACSKDYGVTDADIQAAKEARNPASLKPCFIGCITKEIGFIDYKGDYDLDTGLENLRVIVKDDEKYNRIAEVAKACSSVNDKAVTDGRAGCERAVLLAECFLAHKSRLII